MCVMKKEILIFIIVYTLGSSLFTFSSDEVQKNISVELMFDENFQERLSGPQHIWLNDGKILLLDNNKKKESRTLEFFDPQTKKRAAALDGSKTLNQLRKLCGKESPSLITWPAGVDKNGKAVVYIIDGDLFCIELEKSAVKQLTATTQAETSVQFSPDGKWISFIRANDIYIINWRDNTEKRLTEGATDTLLNGPLSWVYWEEIYDGTSVPYRWAPDSSAIAYLQTDESPVSISTFVNFRPATQGVVKQRYPKAGQSNPKVRIGIVELSSAQTTWLDCGKYEYIARFKWLRDSQRISVQTLNREQSELHLLFIDRKTGEGQEILIDKQPAWVNLNDSLHFLENDKKFIWMSERDGYQHLYLYDLGGRLIVQLTKGPFMVLSAFGPLVAGNGGLVAVDEASGWIYFTANQLALKEIHLYRVKLNGKELMRVSHERGVHRVRFSPRQKYYLDERSNTQSPPALALYTADGREIMEVKASGKHLLDQYKYSLPEYHLFDTEDGLKLPAMMYKSCDFDPEKKYPAIVYVYGGPGSQQVVDRWRSGWWTWFYLWPSILNQDGFIYFILEVRAGAAMNKALETSVYNEAYGLQNVKDILDGVRWIKKMPFIDGDNLGLWGWSGGGCTTLYTMTHSDVFKAAIAVAPVSDWHFYDTIYTERYMGTPQDNKDGYRITSSVLAASNLKGHLLLIHGSYDDNVHPQNSYAFADELIAHGIDFEMLIYPWRKHGITDRAAHIHHFNLMLNFWEQNLKK